MGKKRGSVVRAKKRADEAGKELASKKADDFDNERFEHKADTELFVISTSALPQKKRMKTDSKKLSLSNSKEAKSKIKKSKIHHVSDKDEREIKKILRNHSADGVAVLVEKGRDSVDKRRRSKRLANKNKTNFDLWNDKTVGEDKIVTEITGVASAAGTAPIQLKSVPKIILRKDLQQAAPLSNKLVKARKIFKALKRQTVTVEVAQPGQSFNPDQEQHQDTIGEALSIELRRKEAIEYKAKPISQGMSEETLRILAGSSDEEDSSDDEHKVSSMKPEKRKEKITRAKRNRQKRAKLLANKMKEKKSKKQFLNSLQDAKQINKKLRKEDIAHQEKRTEMQKKIDGTKSKPLGIDILTKLAALDPIHVPSLPVALTDDLKEHGSSLRTIKPKGSLITDRLESMFVRNMTNRKALHKKNVVQGKRRKMKGGKGREYLLS